jgi:hypothetical protein
VVLVAVLRGATVAGLGFPNGEIEELCVGIWSANDGIPMLAGEPPAAWHGQTVELSPSTSVAHTGSPAVLSDTIDTAVCVGVILR